MAVVSICFPLSADSRSLSCHTLTSEVVHSSRCSGTCIEAFPTSQRAVFMMQMQSMSAHQTPDLEETTSITNPKPTVDARAYGFWEKKSRTLTVWSYAGRHQAEGLQHRTSIAESLARGLSQSDRSFHSVHKTTKTATTSTTTKTSHGYQYKNKISPPQRRSCARLETSISIPKPNPTETGREAENADQDAAARGVKMRKSSQAVKEILHTMLMDLC